MTDDDRYISDERVVKELVKQAYVSAGFTKPSFDGLPTEKDTSKAKAKLLELINSKRVPDTDHVSENAWTISELVNSLFPEAPGSDGTPIERLTLNQQKARELLKRAVSSDLKTTKDGWIQKKLTGEAVLCHSQITREGNDVPGVYVTDDDDLRVRHNLKPVLDRYVAASSALRQQTDMLMERGLPAGRVHAELITARARILAALTYPGMPELAPIQENGRKHKVTEDA